MKRGVFDLNSLGWRMYQFIFTKELVLSTSLFPKTGSTKV